MLIQFHLLPQTSQFAFHVNTFSCCFHSVGMGSRLYRQIKLSELAKGGLFSFFAKLAWQSYVSFKIGWTSKNITYITVECIQSVQWCFGCKMLCMHTV